MSSNIKLGIVLGVILAAMVTSILYGEVKDYLHSNSATYEGNTAGNLNNGGLFCQVDDVVYFANAYDDGCLYRMNVDETDIVKLSGMKATYINADDTYIYYYVSELSTLSGMAGMSAKTLGIYRSSLNGKHEHCLDQVSCGVVKLLGNRLYYQRYEDKYKVLQCYNTQSGKSSQENKEKINPACVFDGDIYYSGIDDLYLYRYDVTTQSSSLVMDTRCYNIDIQGYYIYFMNVEDDYALYSSALYGGEQTKLTEDRLDSYLICGDQIFYTKSSDTDACLMVMDLDGSNATVVAEGIYTDLQATSRYLYFTQYGIDNVVYKVSLTDSSHTVYTFDAAKEAALAAYN